MNDLMTGDPFAYIYDYNRPPARPETDEEAMAWYSGHVMRSQQDHSKFAVWVWLTPALARVLLNHNKHNRSRSEKRIAMYVREIRKGRWEGNGETVIIAVTGNLNNGQHRCVAVVRTGTAVETLVSFGTSEASAAKIDHLKIRTPADELHRRDVPGAKNAAATARRYINLAKGNLIEHDCDQDDLVALTMDNPELSVHRQVLHNIQKQYKISYAMLHAVYLHVHPAYPAEADEFFEKLDSGLGLSDRKHPVKVLRDRLQENLARAAKLSAEDVWILVTKAWNAFVTGKVLHLPKYGAREPGEAPPALVGLGAPAAPGEHASKGGLTRQRQRPAARPADRWFQGTML